jgi:WD40 repeat protein
MIVTTSLDKTIKLWNVVDQNLIVTFVGHNASVILFICSKISIGYLLCKFCYFHTLEKLFEILDFIMYRTVYEK